MRNLILGVVIVVGVPAYAMGQQRDRSQRSATERTAVPRAEAAERVSERQTDRRAEPRGTRTPPPRNGSPNDDTPPRASRERPDRSSAHETVRGRVRDERRQPVPARAEWARPPRAQGVRPAVVPPARGFQQFGDRQHWRPGQIDGNYRPRYRRPHRDANVVFVPYAAPVYVEHTVVVERDVVDEPQSPVIIEEPLPARLSLDIHPPTAQIFAAGYYIGIPEDFQWEPGGAVLEPGPHRIDIFARDYEPVSFEVNLTSGQSATFRRTLTPLRRTPQPAPGAAVETQPAAKAPSTFYLIPGCYVGNVPPKEVNLPATCDVARAITRSIDP